MRPRRAVARALPRAVEDPSIAEDMRALLARDSAPPAAFDQGGSSGSVTLDWSKANVQRLLLTDDCALTFSGARPGQTMSVIVEQDATGGHALTWPAGILWPSGVQPVASSGAGAVDVVSLICGPGGSLFGAALAGFQ